MRHTRSGVGILPTVVECRRMWFEDESPHPCAALLVLMDHKKTGPRGPCLDPSPQRFFAPRTRHEVRIFKPGENLSFLYSVLFRSWVDRRGRGAPLRFSARLPLDSVYCTRTTRNNNYYILQEATRLYKVSSCPSLFFTGRGLPKRTRCWSCPELPQSCQDHGKIGQQGSSGATAARLGSGMDSVQQIGFIESVRTFYSLTVALCVSSQVTGTSIRVPKGV